MSDKLGSLSQIRHSYVSTSWQLVGHARCQLSLLLRKLSNSIEVPCGHANSKQLEIKEELMLVIDEVLEVA